MRRCSYRQPILATAMILVAAAMPLAATGPAGPSTSATPAAHKASWWSFQKLRRPQTPWLKQNRPPANPIDAFVLAKLREKRLAPGPATGKATLLRRAYFDLLGLPPTPTQVERFLQDASPDAYEKLIEELLASPRYGERWGGRWLKVVGYADSSLEANGYYPNAWRYRDYVVKSFNDDKPYDRFVQEQIAGDELFPNNLELEGFYDLSPEKLEHMEAWVGTTLLALGPEGRGLRLDAEAARYQWLTHVVDKTASSFLGLTLKCARCHDHKSDPFSQEDYFKLQAIFAASRPSTIPVVASTTMGHRDEAYHLAIALVEARDAYLRFVQQVRDRVVETKKKDYPAGVVRAYEIPIVERTAPEMALAAPVDKLHREVKIEESLTPKEAERHRELTRKLAKAAVAIPAKGLAHQVDYDGFYDVPAATVLGPLRTELIPETHLLDRGDLASKKHVVHPGLPKALRKDSVPAKLSGETGRTHYRRQLALWLTQPTHPLTARVMVNRIWQGHFGQGLVRTAGDFGRQGDSPSHGELLDWLACEFVDQGWSVKSMHRLIMLSDTYQRDSRFTTARHRRRDPSNRYWWRMNRRRLEGEAVWDAIHQVSGTLNLTMGGRPATPPRSNVEGASLPMKPWWPASDDPAAGRRRGVYLLARRDFPSFDKSHSANSSGNCPAGEVKKEIPAALWRLNNHGLRTQAGQLASRLVREAGTDTSRQVDLAWQWTLARMPSDKEKQGALSLLKQLASKNSSKAENESLRNDLAPLDPAQAAALTQLCLSLFNRDEFTHID